MFLDTCIAFGFSLGIAKLKMYRIREKLLGDIIDREGLSPDPEKIGALHGWPLPPTNLKSLQEFLGVGGFLRPSAGPQYAKILEPVRYWLRPGAKFPMSPEAHRALERLRNLLVETHKLFVEDSQAAASGIRPYEYIADCCGLALGGVHVQLSKDFSRFLPLSYCTQSLTVVQARYHPSEQELYANLISRRKFRKEFGCIPAWGWSDHQNVVRLLHLPADRIGPKQFRWHCEITSDGTTINAINGRECLPTRPTPMEESDLQNGIGAWS